MLIVTWLLLLRFFYFLFSDGLPKPFWFFLASGAALMVAIWTLDTITGGVVGLFSLIYILLFSGELLRINIQALRRGEDGAGILCTGAVIYAIVLAEAVLGRMRVIDQSPEMTLFMSKIGFLIFIFAMSAYLARRFSHTNKDLEAQLVQVKELSARAMEEEVRRKLVEADNARKTQELEEARQLQLSLLPQAVPEMPGLEIAWQMDTATEVGGDYYDYALADDGTLTLALGDATGHGLQSGHMVVAAKSLFQSLADQSDLVATFDTMSRNLKSMNFHRLSMAMALIKINNNQLRMTSAAIPPLLLYRAATSEVEEILIGGLPLGVSDKARYEQREFPLHPGDTLLLMSDGLPERLNDQDEELGYPRTQALFAEVAEQTPAAICEHLARGGEQWADGRPRDDDVTFVVVKVGS